VEGCNRLGGGGGICSVGGSPFRVCILAAIGVYNLRLSSSFELCDFVLRCYFFLFPVVQTDAWVGSIQDDGHIYRHWKCSTNNTFTAGGTLTCLCSGKNIPQACFCESSGLGGDCDGWS
jgi:hypothetical protein